jgi:hypothetical protein
MKITQGRGTEVYEKVYIDDFKRSAALKKDRKKKVVYSPLQLRVKNTCPNFFLE